MITIYKWNETPEELKQLSDLGGDEDYVVVTPPHDPPGEEEDPLLSVVPFAVYSGIFSRSHTRATLPDGRVVYIVEE